MGMGAEIPQEGSPWVGEKKMQLLYMTQIQGSAEQIALMVLSTCVPINQSSLSNSTTTSLSPHSLIALSRPASAHPRSPISTTLTLPANSNPNPRISLFTASTVPSSDTSSTSTTRQLPYCCLAIECRQRRQRAWRSRLRPVLIMQIGSYLGYWVVLQRLLQCWCQSLRRMGLVGCSWRQQAKQAVGVGLNLLVIGVLLSTGRTHQLRISYSSSWQLFPSAGKLANWYSYQNQGRGIWMDRLMFDLWREQQIVEQRISRLRSRWGRDWMGCLGYYGYQE